MTRVRVEIFSISIDGYGAGPDQSIDNPLGVGGEALHDWIVSTRTGGRCMERRAARQGSTTTSLREAQECWRLDHGKEHVRTGSRPLAGHGLEGLVGEQPALSRPGFRPDPSRASAPGDGRRHDLSLRHRRHSRGARSSARGGRREGRADRRRGQHHPAVSSFGTDR